VRIRTNKAQDAGEQTHCVDVRRNGHLKNELSRIGALADKQAVLKIMVVASIQSTKHRGREMTDILAYADKRIAPDVFDEVSAAAPNLLGDPL
jgi:hypothetical protein